MKKYQWVPGTLVFSTEHNTVGKILDNEEPTIGNKVGDELGIANIADCRLATEEEANEFVAEEVAEEAK